MSSQPNDHHSPLPPGPLILIVAYDFFPANQIGARRPTALARFLVSRGYRVAVVSSFAGHDIKAGSEIMPGVLAIPVMNPSRVLIDALVRLKRKISQRFRKSEIPPPYVKATSVARTAIRKDSLKEWIFRTLYFVDEFKRWSWRASRTAIKAAAEHRADLIISSGPPYTAVLAGTYAARKVGIPHIADFRDPWTDCIPSIPHRRMDYLLQRPLERWVVRSASHITSAGSSVADLLATRYPDSAPKLHVVRNGYDGTKQNDSTNTNGRLSILFAGELYLGRDPYPFLDAMESLLQRGDIDADRVRITFMGRQAQYGGHPLSEWLNGKKVSRITTILPHGSADAVSQAVKGATVLLNLAQRQPFSVPAKTYEHLICNREILLICESDSETARVVKGISGVTQVDSRNSEDLEQALLNLYDRHVVQGVMTIPSSEEIRGFSRSAANEKFLEIIEDVVKPKFTTTQ
jgi:hypothetical protein